MEGKVGKCKPQKKEKGEGMSQGAQNLIQQIQQQTVHSVQDFFAKSLGRIKGQLQSNRAQLEGLSEQLPEGDAQALVQEMVDSYYEIETTLDQAAQDQGLEEALNEAAQQEEGQDTAGQVAEQAQDTVGGAAQQAQDTAGEVAGQAQQAAGQVTDQVGQAAQEVQDTAGQAVQGAQETVGGVAGQARQAAQQAQDTAGQAAGQAQDAAGGAAQQAQDAAGQATEQGGGQQQGEQGGGEQEEPNATQAARQKAEELGVDLSQVEGSGSEGRITLKDVQSSAANQQ
jgi:pyruvate/2-oxoglutarate dehydrogenase complex dihydrolipoamide acyltransferase (E2) component